MILVTASATARPASRDHMAEALSTCAAASRGDAGCLEYRFWQDVEDPTSFVSVERWEDRAALDAHMATPHVAELLGALPEMVTGAPVITVHEVSSSTPYA